MRLIAGITLLLAVGAALVAAPDTQPSAKKPAAGTAGKPSGKPASPGLSLDARPGTEVVGWSFTLKNEGRLQARVAGQRARPKSLSEFDVDNLRVETYRGTEEPDITAESPRCTVIRTNDSFLVFSPAPLKAEQADGRFRLEGEGFHLDYTAQRLVVTNHVRSVLRVTLPRPDDSPSPAATRP